MLRQLRSLIVLCLFCGGLGYFVYKGGNFSTRPPVGPQLVYEDTTTPQFLSRCGSPALDRRPVAVTMVTNPEKEPWVQDAARRFGHLCPNIQVQLVFLESLQAAESIAAGKLKPTLWSPDSELALRYSEFLGERAKQPPLFDRTKRVSLVSSPLVWLTTDSRYQVLNAVLGSHRSGEGQWMQVGCAAVPRKTETPPASLSDMQPGLWQELFSGKSTLPTAPPPGDAGATGLQGWGRVRFVHPDPSRSTAGLDTLALLSSDFLFPAAGRAAAAPSSLLAKSALKDQRASLRDWLHRCEAGMPEFPLTAKALADSFFRQGTARYDIVVTYEQAAIPLLNQMRKNPAESLEPLRLIYPEQTLWGNHPVVALEANLPSRREEQAAGARWVAYLLSDSQQNAAIELGFRPGREEMSVVQYKSVDNPFLKLMARGVSAELPHHEPPPFDGEALAELMKIWGEATGRY